MFSKEWKIITLFIATFVITLTACPDKKQKAQTPQSPFTGIWVSEEAIQPYLVYRNRSNPQAFDIEAFCAEAAKNHERRGIPGMSVRRIHAFMINPRGEVFSYSPFDNVVTQNFRDQNFKGVVSTFGWYTRNGFAGFGVQNASLNDAVYDQYLNLAEGRFVRDGDRLLMHSTHRQRPLALVRVTEAEILDYASKVERCPRDLPYGPPAPQPQLNPEAPGFPVNPNYPQFPGPNPGLQEK